jgi:nicotinamide mononucleotide adenylyltransferase
MISRFSQYLVEEEKVIYFTFGRMNPPTIGHGKLLDVLAAKAGRNPYKIFLSQSQDVKKNPLSYSDKIKSIRKMFPKHARNVMINKKVKTPFDALTALYDEGYRKVVMVADSDRIAEYDLRLKQV